MRFQIDQQVPFIRVNFKPGAPRFRKRLDGTEYESVSKSVTFNPIENQEIGHGS